VNKIAAIINLFRKGSEVMNVEAWKAGTINVNAVAAAIVAVVLVARAFGHDLPISDEQAAGLAGGLVALLGVANSLLTAATSARAGLPGLAPAAGNGPSGASGGAGGTCTPGGAGNSPAAVSGAPAPDGLDGVAGRATAAPPARPAPVEGAGVSGSVPGYDGAVRAGRVSPAGPDVYDPAFNPFRDHGA
jgi:hypothetical protein